LALAAIAKPLILILIGYKWIDSVQYLQIMCLYGMLYPLQIVNLNMLNVQKRSDLILKLEIVKKIIFVPVFIVGLYFSLIDMLWAAVIYYYIEYFLNSFYSKRYFGYGTLKQIIDLFPIYLISFLVAISIWSITLLNLSNISTLIIQVFLCVLLFPLSYKLIGLVEYKELKQIVLKLLSENTILKMFTK